MFASKAYKARTKDSDRATTKVVTERSTLASRSFGGNHVEPASILGRCIGNQAVLRLLSHGVGSRVGQRENRPLAHELVQTAQQASNGIVATGQIPAPAGPAPAPSGPDPAPATPPAPSGPAPAPSGPTPAPSGPTPAPSGPTPAPSGPTPTPPSPTPAPPAPTVTIPSAIRGASTPASMAPNRIPPGVDTPVTVGFAGTVNPAAPVTLSVEGSGGTNGTVTINGAPSVTLAGPMTVNLRGTAQTVAGNAGHLRLVATRSGTNLAASAGFSVAAIPNSVSFVQQSLATGDNRGFIVGYSFRSDSGTLGDLNGTLVSERIQIVVHSGIFVPTTTINTSGYIVTTSPQVDTHQVGPLAALVAPGVLQLQQTFMFRDNRTGAMDIPVSSSGFAISHTVGADPAGGFQVVSVKNGAAGTALGIASSAGSGTANATQHV